MIAPRSPLCRNEHLAERGTPPVYVRALVPQGVCVWTIWAHSGLCGVHADGGVPSKWLVGICSLGHSRASSVPIVFFPTL